jgi:hypothetical protein
MEFTYLTQPPKRYTFQQPKLREWTEKQCKGKVLNLFAGTTKLNVNEVRVDIDKNVPADYYMEAFEFVNFAKEQGMKFDTIVLDPPYNLRKSREKYGGRYIGSFTKIKNALLPLMNDGCIVISYGYDTVGMSKCRGFEKIGVCVVCHNGDHNDTLCLVEQLIATPSYSSEANASSSANAESLIGIKRVSDETPNLLTQTSLNFDIQSNFQTASSSEVQLNRK